MSESVAEAAGSAERRRRTRRGGSRIASCDLGSRRVRAVWTPYAAASLLAATEIDGSKMFSKSVCVIGAGASGLACIAQLKARGLSVTAFEARSAAGGAWCYDVDPGPCEIAYDGDQPFVRETVEQARTPMYDHLHTNLPHRLSALTSSLQLTISGLPISAVPSRHAHVSRSRSRPVVHPIGSAGPLGCHSCVATATPR